MVKWGNSSSNGDMADLGDLAGRIGQVAPLVGVTRDVPNATSAGKAVGRCAG
jgi:hypothetical protein